ncbi:hypothetical protein [Occallatibacter savannae]|uniref:hypothetical protein n=1 Tax=Occallatibacter savannae TaxID=1002691 RepID=UPI000D699500|nr:hypothetical protein [Occallatibacter savannae]
MKDPFSKNEVLEPELEQIIHRLARGDYDFDRPLMREPDGTVRLLDAFSFPIGALIEVKNWLRGRYIGNGYLLVDFEYLLIERGTFPFEWIPIRKRRVRLKPHWHASEVGSGS